MMRLILATNNTHKLAEMRRMLSGLAVQTLSPSDLGLDVDIEEFGETFAENAAIKARALFRLSGYATLADDSGICIDALDGAPGVRSARFGGLDGDEAAQNRLVLDLMADTDEPERGAEFVAAVAFAAPGGEQWGIEGRTRGMITRAPRDGRYGFGYDPIFLVTESGMTYAEITGPEKDAVSHRGKAMRLALEPLENRIRLLE